MRFFGKVFKKEWLLALGFLVSVAVIPSVVVADVMAPNEVIQRTTDSLLKALKDNGDKFAEDKTLVYGLVSEIILPHFDFVSMSKLALGKNWRKADAAQRAAFVDEFRSLLINTYAVALTHYTNQEVRIRPFKSKKGDRRVTVKTEINQPGGVAIPMHYKLLFKKEKWKVYDVVVDGVSMVTNYRAAFGQDIRKGGVDAVIEGLKRRNAKHKIVATEQDPVAANESQD